MKVSISLLIGLLFSPIAGAMAFLIFYNEYQHHFPDKKRPFKIAMEAAIVTLALFVVLSIIAGLFIAKAQ